MPGVGVDVVVDADVGMWRSKEVKGLELTILVPTLNFTRTLEPHINQNRERQI
jgi:hypothetical protein